MPVAPVNSGADVTSFSHLVERGVFVEDPTGEFRMPRRPWIIGGEPPPPARPSPVLDQHKGDVAPHVRQRPATDPGAVIQLPLEGIRVLDLTNWWAGPFGTGVLAALGAEVIHIESPTRIDGMRTTGGRITTEGDWWELSSHFLSVNANKLGVALDLRTTQGQSLLGQLIDCSDLLVENFTPRVLEKFGVTWEEVHERNPACSLIRMPAFGLSGPWRDHTGFAQTMEQVSGLAWLTGHRNDQPRVQGGPSDPNAGLHGAFAALVALATRDVAGRGVLIEVPMVESALNAAAELVIEHTANCATLERMGNRAPSVAPQGLYRCLGSDSWLAISVESDDQWQRLYRVLGEPAWAGIPRLETLEGRLREHDSLDRYLSEWAATKDGRATAEVLLAAGVPAASARDPRALYDHPQFVYRKFHETFEHTTVGARLAPTLPFRFKSVTGWIRCPAPRFGEHNRAVLRDLLDLPETTIEDFETLGVIADRPNL